MKKNHKLSKPYILYMALPLLAIANIATYSNTSALTYSDNVGLNFTFNTSLTVSLSSNDIVINDLVPGSSSDSNVVTVNVLTNNRNGYNLTSTVGNSTHSNPSYDNRNLNHSDTSSNAIFSSLDYGSSITNMSDSTVSDNTWGYSYSDQTVTTPTWSNYSGLPKYDDTTNIATLKTTTGPSASTGDNIGFKIGAKASTTQIQGEYNNVINFAVVGNNNPISLYDAYTNANKTMYQGYYKIQDMSPAICSSVQVEESQLQVIDVRDNNVYTIAKLKDNRCWMTTNLNIEGGTRLSYQDTDFDETWVLPTSNGFGTNNTLPISSANAFFDKNMAYVYNSERNDPSYCSEAPGCYSYYSWTAATVGSGIDISTDDENAPYSICPKNWQLPSSSRIEPYADNSDFFNLAIAYGMNRSYYSTSSATFYNNAGPYTTPNILLAGVYQGRNSFEPGLGVYWSKTNITNAYEESAPYYLELRSGVNTANKYASRRQGFSVRCIANNE